MIIANPIYDVVFKRLMENEKVAKFFIGTLLEQVIESVQVKPQEFTYTNELAGLAVFRLDFIATIKTETGENKKVLIEIQKAKNPIDLMRFRNYLATQYKKEDKINNENIILPITTIYILGFKLPEIDSPCIRVARNYIDLINKTILTQKSDFVEKLTHDCFVVQVDRITDRYQTRLDKLLSVFEQRNFTDDKEITKNYTYNPDLEEVRTITEILHYVGTDPEERKQIEIEQEAWRTVNAMFEEKEKKYQKELEEQRKALNEKDKALNEKDQALYEKDQALYEKDKLIEELMRKLNEQK
ncbi:hypothetical protein C7N43_34860 [Sphingobacteriales bacterium UPWRP_1]|nr:hypothetical protein BVG80_08905 [Sphingobacteriales bacterium TSM_CSM]PSJ72316.1 hypothetical protein C7N43_34860 [Sphingobacteriales bacterium UPWRP_1]